MRTALKNSYFITILSLSALSAHADKTSAPTSNSNTPTVIGSYECERTDSMNNTASYPLTIRKAGATYAFEWSDRQGEPVLYGTGIIHPDMLNFVTTSFWDPKKPDIVGVEVFEVRPDGSLQANWVLQSENHLGSETCTKGNELKDS